MLGPNLFFTITIILGVVWSGVKSQQSEGDSLTDKRVGLPYVIATIMIILIIWGILIIILIILITCILRREKRQQRLNNDQRHNYTHFCLDNNEVMDQKTFGNSTDQINSTFESDTIGLDVPVEKDVSCNETAITQAISFADSDSTQHSTGAAKTLVEIVIPFSHDVPTETCLNKNNDAQTHKSMALDHAPMDLNIPSTLSDEPKVTNEVQKDVDSSAGDVDAPCQPDPVTTDGQEMCGSALQDSTKPTSTTNTDEAHSFSNDSYYVNVGADTAPSSPANSLSSPTNPPYSPTLQSADLVAIYIPYDDSDMAAIAEDQGKSGSVHDPVVKDTAAVDDAHDHDVKETDGNQLQTHAPTTQELQAIPSSKETVKIRSLSDDTIEIPDNDTMPTEGSSPAIDNTPPLTQKKSQPKSSYSVTIDIPPHGSGAMPTLAKDTGIHDQYINPSSDESIKLQRNPAYVTISNERCSTDEAVKLQRNPAYIPINHSSSEMYWYEVIPCTTASIASASSSIGDATIKMVKNPAYHTIHHAN